MNERASKPHSPHMSVFGELRTDGIGNPLKEESPIKDSYVSKYMYVHNKTPCSHGVRTDRKIQTTPKKAVHKSS